VPDRKRRENIRARRLSIEADGRQDSIGARIGLQFAGAGNSTGRSRPFVIEREGAAARPIACILRLKLIHD
jgi:hypothetical protein